MAYVNASPLQSFMSRTDSHNYCKFYKWEQLIHVRLRTKIYKLKNERSWYIDQDQDTYTNGTWSREHEPQNKTR